jgi:hypothetical protein
MRCGRLKLTSSKYRDLDADKIRFAPSNLRLASAAAMSSLSELANVAEAVTMVLEVIVDLG